MPSKTVLIFSPNPDSFWLPALWSQAKTYYLKHGQHPDQWRWHPCYADMWATDLDKVKAIIKVAQPSVFCISLYVWNAKECHEIAQWVRQEFPQCVIVSGGPHQYFKYDSNWFQDRPWLDASLPGDSYGEITIAEILDSHDNLDWNKITGVVYPKGKHRQIYHSKKTLDRMSFDFTWPQYAERGQDIKQLLEYKYEHRSKMPTCVILETTRGCPYTCTFCDWGGGIGSKLVKKPLLVVKQDIDALINLNMKIIYVADANLGILGQRDLDIVEHFVEHRKTCEFKVMYGGLAKTEHHVPYLKKIIQATRQGNLDLRGAFKLSMQSLDSNVLANINRTNISLDTLLELHQTSGACGYIEFILALPGSTYEMMLSEIDVMIDNDLFGEWYEWILLPEAPAYDPAYRSKFGIKTVRKTAWIGQQREQEVVVGTNTCTTNDYLKMLLAQSWYNLFVQCGINPQTSGKEIDNLINDFLPSTPYWSIINSQWQQILSDPNRSCHIIINNQAMPLKHFFSHLIFYEYENFLPMLEHRLNKKLDIIHAGNIGQQRWQGLKKIVYKNNSIKTEKDLDVETMSNYASRQLLIPETKLLGFL